MKGFTISAVKKQVRDDRIITLEDATKLYSYLNHHRPKLGLMVGFLWKTGLRVGELTGIRLSDLREDDEYTLVTVHRKRDIVRMVQVKTSLIQAVKDVFRGKLYLFETSGGKQYRTTYVSDEIKKSATKIIHRVISAHTLRHSHATHYLGVTGKLKALSEHLGHASTATTADLYVHGRVTEEELELFG